MQAAYNRIALLSSPSLQWVPAASLVASAIQDIYLATEDDEDAVAVTDGEAAKWGWPPRSS